MLMADNAEWPGAGNTCWHLGSLGLPLGLYPTCIEDLQNRNNNQGWQNSNKFRSKRFPVVHGENQIRT